MNNARRLLRPHIDAYRAALAECRSDLGAMHFAYECRMADLHRELDTCRSELDELKGAIRARQRAEQELAGLYRERELMRALRAERDPALPLN